MEAERSSGGGAAPVTSAGVASASVLARPVGRVWSPTGKTVLLSAVIAVSGGALATIMASDPLLAAPSGAAAVALGAVLGLGFFAAEMGQALIELRRQAYAFSLSGVPLLLGLLYLPPDRLLGIRLTAALLAFVVQRSSPVKIAFNTASFLLDTTLVVHLTHSLRPPGAQLDLATAAACYVALACVDVVMTLLVMLVIRINSGPVTRRDLAQVLVPAAASVLLSTCLALLAAVLFSDGPVGMVLLVVVAVVTTTVYRGFLVLRARHQSLEQVQEFVAHSEAAGSVGELADRMLSQIRILLRAARVELMVLDEHDVATMQRAVDHDDARPRALLDLAPVRGQQTSGGAELVLHPVVLDCLSSGTSLRLSRRRTVGPARRWLADKDVDEALVVPLSASGTRGVVVALGRVGSEATAFSDDDLALLQTLAGHLAVALHDRSLVERLQYDATTDGLTGLPNRTLLIDRVRRELADSASGPPAVLLLDLNRFKEVNDVLGHHVGDELLQVVAERLRTSIREDATVARLGGDEFAVLLPFSPRADGAVAVDQSAAAEATALTVAERMTRALSGAVSLSDVVVSTEASIGVAVAVPGQGHADLLRHADAAMYEAKSAGVPVAVFTPHLEQGRAERLALLADLHVALERDELEVEYQPKLDLRRGRVTGVEALVRWFHPELGRLSPDVFVPLAESTGLMDALTATVLRKAVRQCRRWQDEGLDLAVAVNLSARNISNTALPEQVAAVLRDAGLAAQRLILEITESAVMGDKERTMPTLEALVDLGVTLSLDDFGTGHSSLSYLRELPVQELKIDRSFVTGFDAEHVDATGRLMVQSIIALGQGLGLRIVAEGVETRRALATLTALGCDVAQGYHLSRPVPAAEVPAVVGRISAQRWQRTLTPAGSSE